MQSSPLGEGVDEGAALRSIRPEDASHQPTSRRQPLAEKEKAIARTKDILEASFFSIARVVRTNRFAEILRLRLRMTPNERLRENRQPLSWQ
jgi:hypothetical protein